MSRWDDLFNEPKSDRPASTLTIVSDTGNATSYAAAALRREAESVATAPDGTRNHTLNKAWFNMGRHVGAGSIDAGTVRTALAEAGRACGLPQAEIDLVLRDDDTRALHAGAAVPRVPAPLAPVPEVTVLDPKVELDFWQARPILEHLHDFARARMTSPWAVLGVTLARVITAVPHQVVLPPLIGGRASLNLFVGLVGPSGGGKGTAEAAAADALSIGYIRTARIASGEAIAHVYKKRTKGQEPEWRDESHAALISVPEIDRLAGQSARQGSTIMADLRSAWSGELLGQVAADSSRSIPLEAHQYRLCLVAGVQPARAGVLLDDADGGTPQRFLWLPATDPDIPDREPPEPRPQPWEPPRVSSFVSAGGARVDICAAARETIMEAHRARQRGDGDALDGHALLTRLKTAAALGILNGAYAVTDEDWELAGVIAEKSAATRAAVVQLRMSRLKASAEARAEADADRAVFVQNRLEDAAIKRVCGVIVRRLRRTPDDGWTPRHEIRKAAAARDRQHVDEALERLLGSGQIERDEAPETARRGAQFRLTERPS